MSNSTVVSVSVVTRGTKAATLFNQFDKTKVTDEQSVKDLFNTFYGEDSHGSYSNMRRTYVLYAIDSDGNRTDAEYRYFDAATGGAYPTPALIINKGTRVLPVDWKEVYIEIFSYRNNGNWENNGNFLVAVKHDNGSILGHVLPAMY